MAGVALWNGSVLSEQRTVWFLVYLFNEMAVEEEPNSMKDEEFEEEEHLLLVHVLPEGVATAEEEDIATR